MIFDENLMRRQPTPDERKQALARADVQKLRGLVLSRIAVRKSKPNRG
ncbi:MAG TPA: hypothetical protein VEF04_20475 [Blastocatellia bacterium]|nr:hypothetical protein [Blastocatellia bacterium]